MLLNEAEAESFVNKVLTAVNNALPKGKSFEKLTNGEKVKFFSSHFWDGSRWINSELASRVKSAILNSSKGVVVGITTPDKLIPGLSSPKNIATKSLSLLTRGAVLALPGGMAVGVFLGLVFGALNPDKVDKNFESSKKIVTDKIKKLFRKDGKERV